MTDFVNLTSNERVDLADLSFACFDSQFAAQRLLPDQLLTNITAQRLWVLSGFGATNPTGLQVQVNRGVAILGYRTGATVNYGTILAEGNASQILDMTSYAAGTYTLYLGFQLTPSATTSRTQWNAASGAENAVSQNTRLSSNWMIRAELTNPGAEYLAIATVVISGGAMTITDARPFYFEGSNPSGYAQVWGTGANDRSTDRADYGVQDFHTFCDAMKTCLEDIKGPGLARWWAPGVAGQNIGLAGLPTAGRTAWVDANFYAQGSTTAPRMQWDVNAAATFTRASQSFGWTTATGSTTWRGNAGWTSTSATSTAGSAEAFTAAVGSGYASIAYGVTSAYGGYTASGAVLQSSDQWTILAGASLVALAILSSGLVGINIAQPSTQLHVRGTGLTLDAGSSTTQMALIPSATGGSDGSNALLLRDVSANTSFLRYTRSTQVVDFPNGATPLLPSALQPVQMAAAQTVSVIPPAVGIPAVGAIASSSTNFGFSPATAGPAYTPTSGAVRVLFPLPMPFAGTIQSVTFSVTRGNTGTTSTATVTIAVALWGTRQGLYASKSTTTASYNNTSGTFATQSNPMTTFVLPQSYSSASNLESFFLDISITGLGSSDGVAFGNGNYVTVSTQSIGVVSAG